MAAKRCDERAIELADEPVEAVIIDFKNAVCHVTCLRSGFEQQRELLRQYVYQTHPRHLEFVEECKGIWKRVRVFDSRLE